jgi:hypothetical protein
MAQAQAIPQRRGASAGWFGVGVIAAVYAALYALNYWLPLQGTNYTTRIWDWSQSALTLAAAAVVVAHRGGLTWRTVLLGLGLGLVSGLSHALNDPAPWWNLWQGLGTWVCFVGGVLLFQGQPAPRVAAFEGVAAGVGRSLLLGVLLAAPLVLLNNLYFFATSGGTLVLQNPALSAARALSPGIHEEVIFRFFVLALCLALLRNAAARRTAVVVAVIMAVVPHSLNHLPDLFLASPADGLFMLTATSLLFGLPMALLQLRRNLECAIAFHWCIDFLRFLCGY